MPTVLRLQELVSAPSPVPLWASGFELEAGSDPRHGLPVSGDFVALHGLNTAGHFNGSCGRLSFLTVAFNDGFVIWRLALE